MPIPIVELLGKPNCHLCEDARDTLLELKQSHFFELRTVNILNDDALFAKYVDEIPVLLVNGEFFSMYTVDTQALGAYLTTLIS